MRGVAVVLAEVGLDAHALLKRYRLPLVVDDEEQQVSIDAYAGLLEEAAVLSGCRDIGLRVAKAQDISILGPLAIAMQHCATVGEAMYTCSRYLYMQSPALVMEVREMSHWSPDYVEVRFDFHSGEKRHRPQVLEQSLADLATIVRFLSDGRSRPYQVNLPHAMQGAAMAYRGAFGEALIADNMENGGVILPRKDMDIALGGLNETLKQMSTRYLQMAYDSPTNSVADQVRHILRRALGTSQATKNAVADLLYMHPRTLQRRLSAEATSFEEIRQQEQKTRVLRYLQQTNVPLSQIAPFAGLSEQSALTRACRQWFGATPAQIRRRS